MEIRIAWLVAPMALLAMGCRPPEGREAVTAGAEEGGRAVEEQNAVTTPESQVVSLDEYAGSGVGGEVRLVRGADRLELMVTVRNARAGATLPVRLHAGRCEALDLAFAELEPVSTDDLGGGESRSELAADDHPEVRDPTALAVHVHDEEALPIACAELP